jgi:integrase
MRKVKKPRVPRRRPKVVDRSGFDALLKQMAGMSIYPVIVLGMATGMRRGEMLALEWTDLDWDRRILEVAKSLEETKAGLRIKSTKSGESRRFAISAKVLDVLREHKREQDQQRAVFGADYANKNLIFARPDGEHYSPDKLGTRVRYAMQRAGLAGVSPTACGTPTHPNCSRKVRLSRQYRNVSDTPLRISLYRFTATLYPRTTKRRPSCGTMRWRISWKGLLHGSVSG